MSSVWILSRKKTQEKKEKRKKCIIHRWSPDSSVYLGRVPGAAAASKSINVSSNVLRRSAWSNTVMKIESTAAYTHRPSLHPVVLPYGLMGVCRRADTLSSAPPVQHHWQDDGRGQYAETRQQSTSTCVWGEIKFWIKTDRNITRSLLLAVCFAPSASAESKQCSLFPSYCVGVLL